MLARAVPLTCVALAVCASSAADADVGVLVLEVPAGPAPGSRVAAALARGAGSAGDRAVADAAAAAIEARAAGALPRARLERFRRTRELVEEGWRAYLQVAGELAATRLEGARREAEALLPWDGGREMYADVALRLGAVLDHLGRGGEATDLLRLAAALDPGRAVTTVEFSPDVVSAFDLARASAPGAVPATIYVTSSAGAPIEASLEIDGREVRGAILELTVGQHVVVARAPGHHPRGVTTAVSAPRAELSIALEPDPLAAALVRHPIAVGASEADAARAIEAVALYADVDAIVVAAAVWRQGGPALLAQRCSGTPARCTAIVEVEYGAAPGGLDAAAAALWRDLRGAERRHPPTLASDPRTSRRQAPPRPMSARRWHRNPWLWTGVGVAAIALGATAAVLVRGDDGTIVTVDPGDFGGAGP